MTDPGSNDQHRFHGGVPSGFTTLACADLQKSGAFYQAMGFVPHERSGEGMIWFERRGRGVIVVASRSRLISLLGVDPGPAGGMTLSLDLESASEVNGIFEAGILSGGTACKTPGPTPWGAYAGWLKDPDGFTWEIGFHPRSPFDDEGRLRSPTRSEPS